MNMAAEVSEELSLFDVDSANEDDQVYSVCLDPSNSPVIPLQSVAEPSRSRRKRGPRKRGVLDSSSSSSESDVGAGSSIDNTPKRRNIISRPSSGNESILLEMKEMLSKMSKKVDQNERALQELRKDNASK